MGSRTRRTLRRRIITLKQLHQYYNTITVHGLRPLASPWGGPGSGWSKWAPRALEMRLEPQASVQAWVRAWGLYSSTIANTQCNHNRNVAREASGLWWCIHTQDAPIPWISSFTSEASCPGQQSLRSSCYFTHVVPNTLYPGYDSVLPNWYQWEK